MLHNYASGGEKVWLGRVSKGMLFNGEKLPLSGEGTPAVIKQPFYTQTEFIEG